MFDVHLILLIVCLLSQIGYYWFILIHRGSGVSFEAVFVQKSGCRFLEIKVMG